MYCLSQPPDVLHALLELCSETLSELDGEIAIGEKAQEKQWVFAKGQAYSYRTGVLPLGFSVFFRYKGISGERGLTCVLLCCDYKPTDTPEQGWTQTSWNVLPTAYCLETKDVPCMAHSTAMQSNPRGSQSRSQAAAQCSVPSWVWAQDNLCAKVILLPKHNLAASSTWLTWSDTNSPENRSISYRYFTPAQFAFSEWWDTHLKQVSMVCLSLLSWWCGCVLPCFCEMAM